MCFPLTRQLARQTMARIDTDRIKAGDLHEKALLVPLFLHLVDYFLNFRVSVALTDIPGSV
jgi:hypothetical protein